MLATDHINKQTILKQLKTRFLGRPTIVLETCSSTNDLASESANHGAPHGLTIVAEEQTKGRGRLGRRWLSPKGGIWISIILREGLTSTVCNGLPLTAALAVARVLDSQLRVRAHVRWPNDVVVDSRKLAGILVEAKSKGNELDYALVGVGINANFPVETIKEVSEQSTSLLDLLGFPINRETLISTILSEMEYLNELLTTNHSQILQLLGQMECSVGQIVLVRLREGEISGVFDGYESLSKVRIATRAGTVETIDANTVTSIEYCIASA